MSKIKPQPQPHLSDAMAKSAALEYAESVERSEEHPLAARAASLKSTLAPRFALFVQDLSELTALALLDPSPSGRDTLAAQSMRLALSEHPEWIHAANDLVGDSLSKKGFDALRSWLL